MHAWHPRNPPRSTPPPHSKTKLSASFAEFDREHLRIQLLERSIFAQEHSRQQKVHHQRNQQWLATQSHHALRAAASTTYHSNSYPATSSMPRSASAVNVDHSCNTTYITSSPIRKSKRNIRINDHLSSEETRAIKKSLAAVKEMRVNAKKIEQAEQATRHLLAVNRRKKEVERLLFQLESFSDPKELTQNQKDTKTTRQAVGFDLTSMQQSREQSDLELSSIVDNKDLLKNFQLEAPPMEGGKIVDPIKAYAAVALWGQKAMATNKSLLLFAANTKDMLEDQLSQVEDKLNLSNQTIVLLKKEEQRLNNEISVLKRQINEYQVKLKNLVQRIESMTSRIKTMENEFKVRTNALRDEITGMKKELNAMSHQLHLVTVERDALSVQVTAMEQQIRQLEVNLAKAIQELQVMHRKYDALKIERDALMVENNQQKDTIEQQETEINGLKTDLVRVKHEMETMENKYIKERETMVDLHQKEIKGMQQQMDKQKKESDAIIHALKKEIQMSKDQMARDREKIKQQKAAAASANEAKQKAKALADEQAAALKQALYRPPTHEMGTQAPEGDAAAIEKARLDKLANLAKERLGMMDNDLLSHSLQVEDVTNNWILKMEEQKQHYLKLQEKTRTTDCGVQTPIELLSGYVDQDQLKECLEMEELAKVVIQKWLSESVSKIFLNDTELKHLVEKLDFERKGPAAQLLKLIRRRSDQALALSRVILKDVGRHHRRTNQKNALLCFKSNLITSNIKLLLQQEKQANSTNTNKLLAYKNRLKSQNIVHDQELSELELRVLREESLSSIVQAKTYKSIAGLVRQTTTVLSQWQARRKKEQEQLGMLHGEPQPIELVERDELDGGIEGGGANGGANSGGSPFARHMKTKKEDMHEYQQMKSLGEHCARWMLLIEKKLPLLVASSDRTRREIGIKNKKNQVKNDTHRASSIGYQDQMRQMKNVVRRGSGSGSGSMEVKVKK